MARLSKRPVKLHEEAIALPDKAALNGLKEQLAAMHYYNIGASPKMKLANPSGPEAIRAIRALQCKLGEVMEALTPSAETKAVYMGEFAIKFPEFDGDGEEYTRSINVPWTTIKEIMAAIRERANLIEEEQ